MEVPGFCKILVRQQTTGFQSKGLNPVPPLDSHDRILFLCCLQPSCGYFWLLPRVDGVCTLWLQTSSWQYGSLVPSGWQQLRALCFYRSEPKWVRVLSRLVASAAFPSYLSELPIISKNEQEEASGTGRCKNPSQQTTLAVLRDNRVVNFVTGILT